METRRYLNPDAGRSPWETDAREAPPSLSRHAMRRTQQRAISSLILDWLLELGVRASAGGGAEIAYFNQRGRRALARAIGAKTYAQFEQKLSTAYSVVGDDGCIVTAGHRTARVWRR